MLDKTSRAGRTRKASRAHSGRANPGSGAVSRSGSGGGPSTSSRSDSTGGHQLPRLGRLSSSQTPKTSGS